MSIAMTLLMSFSFSSAFVLFLVFLYIHLLRREETALHTSQLFLWTSVYILGEMMLVMVSDFRWKVFWQRVEYLGPAGLMTAFPLAALSYAATVSGGTPRSLRILFGRVMPWFSLAFGVLLFWGDLLVTERPYFYSGFILQGREGPFFPIYAAFLFLSLGVGYAIILSSFLRSRRRDDWPLVAATTVGLLTGVFDVLRVLLPSPVRFGSFFAHGLFLMSFLYGYTILRQLDRLYRKIDEDERTIRALLSLSDKDFTDLVAVLIHIIDAKDRYTAGHSMRVAEYAVKLGETLNLDEATLKNLRVAGLLHDIGKIGVSESILNKPDRLTAEEYEAVKKHSELGALILQHADDFRNIVPCVRHHHEHIDGSGYPDGLRGEEILLPARILAVVDTYDALTSDRPYRARLPLGDALRILREAAGHQLDPDLVDRFCGLVADLDASASSAA